MAFANISLLLGGMFMAIPVVVHLTMRRKPQHQVFPALQFLRERRDSNRQQLELRHWLLLLLRCGLIGILAMALARPSVDAPRFAQSMLIGLVVTGLLFTGALTFAATRQRRGATVIGILGTLCGVLVLALIALMFALTGREAQRTIGHRRAPVAAVLVVDTAPRMEYRFENQTRLEAASEMAHWLLDQLPSGSHVALVETRPGPAVFSVDFSAAHAAIGRLQTSALVEPIAATAMRGLDLLNDSPLQRKELYLFGDLSDKAWPPNLASQLRGAMSNRPDTTCYVVDLGIENPTNTGLGDVHVSSERSVLRSDLTISTELFNHGEARGQIVELLVEQPDTDRPLIVNGDVQLPELKRHDQTVVELSEQDSQLVSFQLRNLPLGVHHGVIRLQGADGLVLDNARHFTVEVGPAWRVLVVTPANVAPNLFVEAIAPHEFRQAGKSMFDCQLLDQHQLASLDLSPFAAICLLNPKPLATESSTAVAEYVAAGGSLALFLGHNAEPAASFNGLPMDDLIGGRLNDQWRAAGRELILSPLRFEHPILAPFRDQASRVPWRDAPIFLHWVLDLSNQATAIASFSNGKPALVENDYGRGRVLTFATSVTDPLLPRGRSAWNELPTSENAWPYLILVNEMMQHLVNRHGSRRNFRPGETVAIQNDPERDPQRYQLFAPSQAPVEVSAQEDRVTIRFTEQTGVYRLKGRRDKPVVRGFSVNTPAELTDLSRLARESLADFFGPDGYDYARAKDEILRRVGQSRTGSEFYPYLVVALVFVVGLEHLLANRFYRGSE